MYQIDIENQTRSGDILESRPQASPASSAQVQRPIGVGWVGDGDGEPGTHGVCVQTADVVV